jgi:transposase-like protein
VHVVTPEQIVVQAFRAGMSVEEIARGSGCSPSLVRRILGDQGLLDPPRGRPWPYDAAAERDLAASYAEGATMAAIVERFGGNNRSIRAVLEHRGVRVRPAGRRPRTS